MTTKTFKTNMVTQEGLFNWVYLDTPKANTLDPTKPPQYSVTFVFSKNDPNSKLEQMNACISDALEKLFGDKKPAKYKNPIKDGDVETDSNGMVRYPGCYFFDAKNKTKPGIVNKDREEIFESNAIWSGCKGKLSIGFVAYDLPTGKVVTTYLNNVMLTDNSAPKQSGKRSASEDFNDE
jgi:hypothetical protein